MKRTIFHGECVCTEITKQKFEKQTEGLTQLEKNDYQIIAESEVTGNHHRVLTKDKDIEFYEIDGVLYAKVNTPTEINCVLTERHDTVELPTGYWEFQKATEYNPFERVSKRVAD